MPSKNQAESADFSQSCSDNTKGTARFFGRAFSFSFIADRYGYANQIPFPATPAATPDNSGNDVLSLQHGVDSLVETLTEEILSIDKI